MGSIRITSTARKHKLSNRRIREALATSVFIEMDDDMAIYRGTDATGLDIELGIVKDDRGTGYAVIHAMPMKWRNQ